VLSNNAIYNMLATYPAIADLSPFYLFDFDVLNVKTAPNFDAITRERYSQ